MGICQAGLAENRRYSGNRVPSIFLPIANVLEKQRRSAIIISKSILSFPIQDFFRKTQKVWKHWNKTGVPKPYIVEGKTKRGEILAKQKGPKGFIVVLPHGIIEIPQDSYVSWLTLFFALPQELVIKRSAYMELPRCPDEVLRTDKYDALIKSDTFIERVWDCYAWAAWQFFQVPDRKGGYRDIPGDCSFFCGKGALL